MNIPYGPLLVVEDVTNIRELLTVTLRFKGYPVKTAQNGKEALEMIAKDRPALIITDILMPVMDGVEATRRIMAEAPCPILVVTATVDGTYARVYDALGAGALDAVDTPRLGADGGLVGAESLHGDIETPGFDVDSLRSVAEALQLAVLDVLNCFVNTV